MGDPTYCPHYLAGWHGWAPGLDDPVMNLVIKPRYRPVPEIRVKGTGGMITLGPQHIIFNLIPDVTLRAWPLVSFWTVDSSKQNARPNFSDF